MKKFVSLLIAIILLSSALAGCNLGMWFADTTASTTSEIVNTPQEEVITDELRLEIIERYLVLSGIQGDKKPEEIECEFYGKYGDSVAVYFHTAGAHQRITEEDVAGFKFSYLDSRVIKIWNNRRFYTMSEAYELGLINKDNVESIFAGFQTKIFKSPYFVFEREFLFDWDNHNAIINEEDFWYLEPGQLMVGLDKSISSHRKDFNYDFFEDIDYEYIEDMTYWNQFEKDELPERCEEWMTMEFKIHLKDKSEEALFEAIAILEQNDALNYVTPLYRFTRPENPFPFDYRSIPNDPYFDDELMQEITSSDQWGLINIEVEKVWDFTKGASTLKVGIIDSGIASHEDIDSNYLYRDNFRVDVALHFYGNPAGVYIEQYPEDYFSHGTHVAGIIGAVGNNDIGISGINHQITLVQLSIADAWIYKYEAYRDAVLYAITQNIPILNFSLGRYSDLYKDALVRYSEWGGLFVCAAPNDASNSDGCIDYPGYWGAADCPSADYIDNIITVGNINFYNERSVNSNWGVNRINIYAPGEYILSTVPEDFCSVNYNNGDIVYRTTIDGELCLACECQAIDSNQDGITDSWIKVTTHFDDGYHYNSGTSMATPHVTGVAALLLSVDPNLTATQLKECILEGAEIITITTGTGETQSVKKLNAWGAFQYLMNNYPKYSADIGFVDSTYSASLNSNYDYFVYNNYMQKFAVKDAGEYSFTVSSDESIELKFYDDELNEISVEQIKTNDNKQIQFTVNLNKSTYYLRASFINSSFNETITIFVDAPVHIHNYNQWVEYSPTQHIERCECGVKGTVKANHVVKSSDTSKCMLCGAAIDLVGGFGESIIQNIQKVTPNGSYILPNGIIVLVDEDVEAYFNGTLVFYDKNNLPQTQ